MQLILIKIGKALQVIKRDGVIDGGMRVLKGFFAMFRIVKKGDILFITGGIGDSARFRTQHHAEELQLKGFKCSITIQDNPLLPKYADKFKVFIFHRTLYTQNVQKLIENIKKQQGDIIFETDDLVYDPKFIKHMDYFKQMNKLEKKLYENGLGGEILRDTYVKTCTTTTSFLAEKLEGEGKKVFVVTNKLSQHDLKIAQKVLDKKSERNTDKIKIGYFSGTISHNKDFNSISHALMRLMEKYDNVELFLAGPLDVEHRLFKFADRIKQIPYAPREKHFENISNVDINISPLEVDNPFCQAKSELKFFEAGIVKVPTVATSTETFKKAIDNGVDGFVASTVEQWYDMLEKLVVDKNLRNSMAEKAYEKALSKYSTKTADNTEYYSYLKTIIEK